MSITNERLHEIITTAEKATPGDWAVGTPDYGVHKTRAEWCRSALIAPDEPAAATLWVAWVPDDEEVAGARIVAITGDGPHGMADARLIAAADPTTVADLARELLELRAQREAVLKLHYKADDTAGREPVCPECEGRAGSSEDRVAVCGHCREGWKGVSVPYPCATARAHGVTEEADR